MRSLLTALLITYFVSSACYANNDVAVGPPAPTSVTSSTSLQVSPDALVISGVIAGGNILPLGAKLVEMAAPQKSVDLVINSPGGEVTTGFLFINAMEAAKQRGLHIRCFVPTMAASMAFQILVHCDERYTLDKSFLLWHRAAVTFGGGLFGGSSTLRAPELSKLAEDLSKLDAIILREVIEATQIDPGVASYHLEAQTLHTGSDLAALAPKFIQSRTSIPGLFEALLNKSGPRNRNEDMRRGTGPKYIYIYEEN